MSLNSPTEFKIHVTMTSDWHIGSGTGHGEIDSVVQRDRDDLPYIPAKTLTGILRDGCEQVARALDGGNDRGKWSRWINVLFGDQPATLDPDKDRDQLEHKPRPAILGIHSAKFNDSLQKALNAKPNLKPAIAFMKPGVAIDPATGSAKPDCFRVEEVVRMDAVLTAKNCTLNFDDIPDIDEDGKRAAYALVVAGAKMVERLGGKRRRGNGTCSIEVDKEANKWLQWLKEHHHKIGEPPAWQPPQLQQGQQTTKDEETTSTWCAIPLTITTESPVVLPARTVGNVVECLDYIPGRYLLRYLHKKLGDQLDVSREIAQENLVITNATIAINDQAGRPTPLCLSGAKLDGGLSKGRGVYNRFQEAEPDGIQLKGERSGYVGQFDDTQEPKQLPAYETVKRELFTHNTIRDDVQRPTSDLGGVYSYQAIPEGTVLKAELRIPETIKNTLAIKNWSQTLGGRLRIGQSKKDQYGAVKIQVDAPTPIDHLAEATDYLYVWCLSDVLLRDKRLNPTTNPDDFRLALANALGVTLEERPATEQYLSMMTRSRRTESWQVRWGLPRPSMLGWQAGSCMVYKIQGDSKPTSEKLAEIEAKGIGDRRAEGYGQVCFNDPLLTAKLSTLMRAKASSQPEVTKIPAIKSGAFFHYARVIEQAAWREAIQNQALAIAADANRREAILGIKIVGDASQPSMSQLGGLRSMVSRLTERETTNPVSNWVTAIQKVDNRREKWPSDSRNKVDSLDKVRSLVTDFSQVWTDLGCDQEWANQLTMTARGSEELRTELWAEAVRTLIDAIIRAHKRDWEKAQREETA